MAPSVPARHGQGILWITAVRISVCQWSSTDLRSYVVPSVPDPSRTSTTIDNCGQLSWTSSGLCRDTTRAAPTASRRVSLAICYCDPTACRNGISLGCPLPNNLVQCSWHVCTLRVSLLPCASERPRFTCKKNISRPCC